MLKRKAGGRIVTTEVAVDGMLRDLGKERMTWGCFRHDLLHGMMFRVPEWITSPLMHKVFKGLQKKWEEKERDEKKD